MSLRIKSFVFILFSSFWLSSCGGGSGGNGDLDLPGISDFILTVSMVDGTGAATSTVADGSTTYLEATLTDSEGNVVENQTVVFQLLSSVGRLLESASSVAVETDSSGEAQAQIFAGFTASTGSARATFTDSNGDKAVAEISFTSLGDEPDPDADDSDADTTTTSSSDTATMTMSLVDSDGVSAGTSGNPITTTSPGVLNVTLTSSGGDVLDNEVITFTTTLGTLSPETQLTSSTGVATININAADAAGAGTVTATATIGGDTVTNTINFVIGTQTASTEIAMTLVDSGGTAAGTISNPISSINPGVLRATISDDDGNPLADEVVTFSTTSGTISPLTQLTNSSGVATVALTAGETAGAGTITASVTPGLDTFSDELNFVVSEQSVSAEGASIEFVSASPAAISLQGTGGVGLKESSVVTFRVVDDEGQPVSGQAVDFALTATPGGLALADSSDTSDVDGFVTVTVNAGTVPTVVRVSASFTDSGSDTISVFSDQLTVSTGLPEQSRFTIAAEMLNPQAGSHDGVTVTVTARASDRSGNPAPDGTAIYFTTELGMIQPNCLLTSGACSVTWTSQDATDAEVDGSTGITQFGTNDRFGRSTILAVAVGEESFIDNNSDGVFDATGDTIVAQLSEAFLDKNESGALEDGTGGTLDEEFRDYIVNGSFDAADALYNGSLCSDAALAAGHCARLVEVRDSLVLVMSTDSLRIRFLAGCSYTADYVDSAAPANPPSTWGSTTISGPTYIASIDPSATSSFGVLASDSNGNPPPGGTTFSVSMAASAGGTIVGTSSFEISEGSTEPVCQTVSVTPPAGTAEDSLITVDYVLPDGTAGSTSLTVDYP